MALLGAAVLVVAAGALPATAGGAAATRPTSAPVTTAPAAPPVAAPAAPARKIAPPPEEADATDHPLFQSLVSVGLITMVIWIVRRTASPGKLRLHDTPGRPNNLDPAIVMAILVVWLGTGSLAHWGLGKTYPEESLKLLVLANLISHVSCATACLLAAALAFPHGIRQGLGLNLRHALFDSGRGVLAMLASFPVMMGMAIALQRFFPAQRHPMLSAARELSAGWSALVVFLAVVVAPVSEELLFRGILQSVFRRYTRRPWVGVTVSAGLFAMVHWSVPYSVPSMFLFGLVLGYNYERCGRLYPAILAHTLFNAANMAIYLTARP